MLTAEVDGAFTCGGCGADHALDTLDTLGRTPEDRAARALVFSKQRDIDLASAYSVLLGLLPIVRALATDPVGETAYESKPDAPRAARYDRGFRPAIEAGFLTPRQATERGDRVLYASRMARTHGLSMNLAFRLADNRLSLRDAVRAAAEKSQRSTDPVSAPDDRSAQYARAFGVLAGGTIVLTILGIWIALLLSEQNVKFGGETANSARQAEGLPAPTLDVTAEVRLNAGDDAVEIRGRDPRAVLEAFCKLEPGRKLSGLQPAADGRWTGSYEEAGRRESITIRTTAEGAAWSPTPAVPIEE